MVHTQEKLANLLAEIGQLESVVVGFSGGVDSSLLSAAAYRVLGGKAVAVTAYSPTLPQQEKEQAVATARAIGIRHILLAISELDGPEFVANTPDRCYFCKKQRFAVISQWAKEEGIRWVLEGSNADDVGDYRPGMKAIAELEMVRSPLLDVGLTKEEIRQISKEWGLPTWDKLSVACLSSRVAYNQPVTGDKLRQIEEAETFLQQFCTGQVRVRHHGNLARIEVAAHEIAILGHPEVAEAVTQKLSQLGFTFVTLDLVGYRQGSMNKEIDKLPKLKNGGR